MRLITIATPFLLLSSLLVLGCCPEFLRQQDDLTGYQQQDWNAAPAPSAAGDETECALCAALGLDVNTDAALLGVGANVDGLRGTAVGAEVDVEYGQGSGEDSGSNSSYDYLGKTAGYGSDYTVLRGSLHARYAIPLRQAEVKVVPLAGLGIYHWKEKNCEDPTNAGFCTYDATVFEVGGEVQWKRFGFKLWMPLSNKTPDMSLRLRYHLPFGG